MTFSNPAGNAAASAGAYVRALLEVLGERDPLEVLEELDGWLDRRFAGVPEASLRRPEAPGRWSAADVVQHLADSELVLGFRMRMILTEDRPPIQGYDQDKWAATLHYPEVPFAEARAQLRALRAANLRVLHRLGPEEMQRGGMHSERGPESLGHLIKLMAPTTWCTGGRSIGCSSEAISCQLSVIGYQLSVIGYQLSVIGYQLSAIGKHTGWPRCAY